jgi:hypothetical protein
MCSNFRAIAPRDEVKLLLFCVCGRASEANRVGMKTIPRAIKGVRNAKIQLRC